MAGTLGGEGAQSAHAQPPAQRQREGERLGLLPVHAVQLEPGAGGVLEHLRAGAAQVVDVPARDGDEAAQPDLGVAGGDLGLAAHGRLLGLALARGLRLPEATAQLDGRRVRG